jgi:hypothetical protein
MAGTFTRAHDLNSAVRGVYGMDRKEDAHTFLLAPNEELAE